MRVHVPVLPFTSDDAETTSAERKRASEMEATDPIDPERWETERDSQVARELSEWVPAGSGKVTLLTRIAAGDQTAVVEFIEEYGGLIASLANRYSVSSNDTDDAVQEIFVELWKNASRFQPEKGSEVTFVAMIARRRLVDLYRRRQQRTVVDIEVDNIPFHDELPFGGDLEVDEQMRSVVSVLKQMPDLQRRAILLAIYKGMTHRQVANCMDLPLGTIKTWIRQGLRSMRRELEEKNTPKAVPHPKLLQSVTP